MRKHTTFGILLIASACACHLSAEEAVDTTAHVLKSVEVVAKEQASTKSAAPMRKITQADMLKVGITDVSDALTRMPGIVMHDYGGAGGLKTVSVRGFGTAHTGIVLDGVPLSDVQNGQIDLSRYSIDNVNDVTLVVGDNEEIFKPARMAASVATVNLTSILPSQKKEMEFKLRGGSFGFINPYLRLGIPVGEKVTMNVVGDFTHATNDYPFKLENGEATTTERRNNSRMNSWHAESNLTWQIDNTSQLKGKLYYFDSDRHLPGPVIYYNNVNKERLLEENAFGQAQYRKSLSHRLSLMANVKFNYASTKYHDENGAYPNGVLDQNYWQREWYVSAACLYMPTDKWAASYAADYFYNNLNSNLVSDRRPYRNSVLQTLSVRYRYAHVTAMARALYSVYLNGARKGEASKDANKLSPSVSVSYQPLLSEQLYVRASYKNIFRMPTFTECYFDHLGNTELLPESTEQFNVGVTYGTKSGKLNFTLDGYCNSVRDMIVAVPYNMFVWSMKNMGKARILGVEATAMADFPVGNRQSLYVTANYSLQRAMPRTNPESSEWMKQIAYIPKHSGNASLTYQNPWVNVTVHTSAVSNRYTTNNNLPSTRIDGYAEFGAAVWRAFNFSNMAVDLRFEVLNLFDKQYCIVAKYPMPGRSWRATVCFKI